VYYVIEERDSSKADELSVDTAKSSSSKSRSLMVWTVTSLIIIHKINLTVLLNSHQNTVLLIVGDII